MFSFASLSLSILTWQNVCTKAENLGVKFIWICVCMYIRTHICICICVYMCIFIHTCICWMNFQVLTMCQVVKMSPEFSLRYCITKRLFLAPTWLSFNRESFQMQNCYHAFVLLSFFCPRFYVTAHCLYTPTLFFILYLKIQISRTCSWKSFRKKKVFKNQQ